MDNSVKGTTRKTRGFCRAFESTNTGPGGLQATFQQFCNGNQKDTPEFCRGCELIESGPAGFQASFEQFCREESTRKAREFHRGYGIMNLVLEACRPARDSFVKETIRKTRELCKRCEIVESGPTGMQAIFGQLYEEKPRGNTGAL